LSRVERSNGAKAIDTKPIIERIRELNAAQVELAKRNEQLRELTIAMDTAHRAFAGTDGS
jgi:hypothetical protein